MRRWLGVFAASLVLATLVGSQQQAYYQRMPVISADGSEVLYQAIPIGQPTLDVFQMPFSSMTTQGMQVLIKDALNNDVPLAQNAARPHFSVSQGLHVVYMRGGNDVPFQVYLYDRQKGMEMLISRVGANQGTEPSKPSICPRINGNGRIVAFVSRDPNLHDPNGDGMPDPLPPYATPSAAAPWIIYIHDRDVDGNGTYDETPPQGTAVTQAVAVTSSPYIALSPDTGGTYIAYQVYDPLAKAWGLVVKDWRNNRVTDPPVAVSPVPFSVPSVVGVAQPFTGALVAFTANATFATPYTVVVPPPFNANTPPAGLWVAEVDFGQATPVARLYAVSPNNGVNGAPVLSPDGELLAFHSTATNIQVLNATSPDRNGVDDIFVFSLTAALQRLSSSPPQLPIGIWTTLQLRPPQGTSLETFDPCVHPSLSSIVGNSVFVAFERWLKDPMTGQTQIRVRKVQVDLTSGSGNLLFSLRLPRTRRYVPLPY